MLSELILLGLCGFAVGPILAIIALAKIGTLRGEMGSLRDELDSLRRALHRMSVEMAQTAAPPADAVAPPPHQTPVTPIAAPTADDPSSPPSSPTPSPPPTLSPSPTPSPPPSHKEQTFAERWLVWLGGITLALGGGFFVKYSADQGLLGPEFRVALGVLSGLAAMILGHWLSYRPPENHRLPWHVPLALIGAGGVVIFAALYAGYALFGLIGPLTTFIALAVSAAGLTVMSLRHGPWVALLGLLGAFLVPLLLNTDHPNLPGLLSYVLVVSAGGVALLRYRQWWWLVWVVLGADAAWLGLCLLSQHLSASDQWAASLFLCLLGGLFAALRLGLPRPRLFQGRIDHPVVRRAVAMAAAIIAILALALAQSSDYAIPAQTALVFLAAGLMALGWRDAVFDRLPWLGAAMAVLALAGWEAGLHEMGAIGDILSPALPGEAGRFAQLAMIFAALFGVGGQSLAARTDNPWRWAALSVGGSLAVLAVSYWRLALLGDTWAWTVGALALGVVFVIIAERHRRRESHDSPALIAVHTVGTCAALALAATFALKEAWLSVALAAMIPAIAWIDTHLRLPGLRKTALILAGIVLVRLACNPYVLSYPLDNAPAFDWLLYGYGLPMAAFAYGFHLFRRHGDDRLTQVLESGTIIFAVLLASLEIRRWMAGGLSPSLSYELMEQSLQSLVWLTGSAVLFAIHARSGRIITLRAAQILLALAAGQTLIMQAIVDNPWMGGDDVGQGLILNTLLPAYAAPAALYAILWRLAHPPRLRPWCATLAVGFALLWATMEIRHGFSNRDSLWSGRGSPSEVWAYSALYLLAGIGVLSGGIRLSSRFARHAGLALILAVVVKVFLVDMSQTGGLWRALSFLGLGAGLVGVGWLYRRLGRTDISH